MPTFPDVPVARNGLDHAEVDVAELKARLREAEETLDAIRNGEVDAIVIGGPGGQQVYTLENADRPYRVLIEQMQEGAVTLGDDGTVLYCNQRFAAMAGARRETIIGETVERFFRDGDRQSLLSLLKRGLRGGVSGEFTLYSANDIEIPVNISLVDLKVDEGMPRVVCCVATDLTQNHKRSLELAAANRRLASEIEERGRAEDSLELTLDAAGMGTWDLTLDADNARRSFRHDQIFGYSELQTKWGLETGLNHFVPEDRKLVAEAFAQARTSGTIEFERRINRVGDNAIRWVHVKGRTYYDRDRPVRIAGVIADTTERREIDDQLRQSQKMEAVGQLTGGIAHDFNNLLMIIGGSLDMLSRSAPSDERTRRLLGAALQGVARGSKLNQQLLAFSRRQDLRVEIVSVDELIPNFEHLLDRAVGETVSVKVTPASHVWFCRTDPHQLETAILNLAINARDAMAEGGVLTLATENRQVGAQAAAKWGASAGDYVVVSVADTGAGMPSDVVAHVFEPFFTTKAVGKGTGLGLSQVYGFAKQSGGFVAIDSERGQGTTVSIFLPRTEQPKIAQVAEAPPHGEIEGRGVVLVVEDDPDVRATTGGMLQDLGYEVREAKTGRAALAFLESGETVDLVFTDVIMPDGMNGIELAREVNARHPELPVLLTSGYTAQRLVPDRLNDDLRLLRKPYGRPDLSRAISEAMNAARVIAR